MANRINSSTKIRKKMLRVNKLPSLGELWRLAQLVVILINLEVAEEEVNNEITVTAKMAVKDNPANSSKKVVSSKIDLSLRDRLRLSLI